MKKRMWLRNSLLKHSLLCMSAFSVCSLTVNASDVKSGEFNGLLEESVQQTKTVTGTVLDADGIPIIGANVIVKGTTNGTITDFDGKFSLEVPAKSVLEISYIGYLTVEVDVTNQSKVSVQLKEDTQTLDEVVVVGYGTMRKSDVTGSIATAKGEELTKQQSFSALENLRGKVSGVNIFSNSSQPGAYSNRVVIRGMSTIN